MASPCAHRCRDKAKSGGKAKICNRWANAYFTIFKSNREHNWEGALAHFQKNISLNSIVPIPPLSPT